MGTYSKGTVTQTKHVDRIYNGYIVNFSGEGLYTCPTNTRAKVFIELVASGAIINSHTFTFKHNKQLIASSVKKQVQVTTPGAPNQNNFTYDDGDKGRHGYLKFQTEVSNPYFSLPFSEGENTFDLSEGDILTVDAQFHAGDLNAGEQVGFRLRVEEIGPA